MLAHLERQRATGQLQLGSVARAAELLLASIKCGGHQQLFNHSLRCLEGQLTAAGGDAAVAAEAEVLREALITAVRGSCASSTASLQALLASGLPFDLAAPVEDSEGDHSLVVFAALAESFPAAKVRLLHQAGAAVTAVDLLEVIDRLSAPGVAALLAVARPAVDTRQPTFTSTDMTSYSCPIHRALHSQVRTAASDASGGSARGLKRREPLAHPMGQLCGCESVQTQQH
jgi:hypothetical protein